MKHIVVALGAILCVALPTAAIAGPVIRTGESVTINNTQEVTEDLYATGGTVAVSGNVIGDAYLAGGTVLVNAPVSVDLVAVGGTVGVHAPVGDDFRAAAGEVTITERIDGDVFVFAGSLNILSTARITGDVIFFGGELKVEGPVDGAVYGSADAARIDASVGAIDIRTVRTLTLGDRAEVRGDVVYTGSTEMVRAQNAVVVGTVQQKEQLAPTFDFGSIVIPVFMMLFAALTALLVFRKQVTPIVTLKGHYGILGIIGLAVFLVVPFAALILSLSVLGLFVGLAMLFGYIALLIVSWVLMSMMLGTRLLQYTLKKHNEVSLRSVIIGVLVLELIILIPFIGPLIAFIAFLIVLGYISRMIYYRALGRS